MTISNSFGVLHTLKDPAELWYTFKCETLKAAKECVGEYPRSRSSFAATKTLDRIEENRAARLAGNRDQYRALTLRTRALLRRNNERYDRGFAEDVACHLNANYLPVEL